MHVWMIVTYLGIASPTQTEFLGFASNDPWIALRHHHTIHTEDGGVISFALVEVIDASSQETIATYRATNIRRSGGAHWPYRKVRRFAPAYRDAKPLADWHAFRRQHLLPFDASSPHAFRSPDGRYIVEREKDSEGRFSYAFTIRTIERSEPLPLAAAR